MNQNASLVEASKLINDYLEVYCDKSNKNIVVILNDFFDYIRDISMVSIYTEETWKSLKEYVYEISDERQTIIVEFLLRLMPHFLSIDGINEICHKFYKNNKFTLDFYGPNRQYTMLEIKNDIEEYYILNLILAYNGTIKNDVGDL